MPLNPQFKIQTCKIVRYLLICGILVKAPTCTGLFNSKFCLTAIRRGEIDDRAEGARHRLIKLLQKESSIKCNMSGRDFWSGFQSYLSKNNNHLGTRDRLNYAIKYAHMLDTYDARELLQLSHEKRIHIMKSLTAMI
ncbi:MAG: hypothetical protein ACJ71E_12745 [Nitrososphaeraceae archaeon]